MLSGEATNTNFIVFGFTRQVLKPTIYRTRGEHANHYTTDAVDVKENLNLKKVFCVCMYLYSMGLFCKMTLIDVDIDDRRYSLIKY